MSLFRVTTSRLLFSTSSPLSSSIPKKCSTQVLGLTSSSPLFIGDSRKRSPQFLRTVALVGATFQVKDNLSLKQEQVRQFSSLKSRMYQPPLNTRQTHNATVEPAEGRRLISSRDLTKNLTLYSENPNKIEFDQKTLTFKTPSGNPLVLILSWLLAKPKHVKKYAQIYTDLGYDVLAVYVTPWQLLWPTKGTQLVAADTVKFLENNPSYSRIVVHGFSVGAYQIGEMMLIMSKDMERYQPVLDRVISQVWDSAADITEIPAGVPKSIFPKNKRLESALRNYILYHLKTFHNQATVHYMRSSQMFHSTLLKVPALFFVSENDIIGPPSSNRAVTDNWERANVKITFKSWEKSFHAAHFIKHRDEYLSELFKHFENTGVLEHLPVKSRVKL